MAIPIPTNYDLKAPLPLDSRYIVNTYAELTGLQNKYSGMQGFVAIEKKLYYLEDLNLNKWTQIGSGNIAANLNDDIIVNKNIFRISNTGRGNTFGGEIILSGGSATGSGVGFQNPNIGGPIRFIAGSGRQLSGFFDFHGETLSFNNNAFLINRNGNVTCKSISSSERPQVNGTGVLLQGEVSIGNNVAFNTISGIDNDLSPSLTIQGANNVYEPYQDNYKGGDIIIKGGSGNSDGGSVYIVAGDTTQNNYTYISVDNNAIILNGSVFVSDNLNVVGNLQANGINVDPLKYLDKTQNQEIENYINFIDTLNIKDNLFHYSEPVGVITGFNQINFPNFTGKGDGGYFLGRKKITQNTLILKEDSIGSNYVAKQLLNGQAFSDIALSSDGKYISVIDSQFLGKLHISQDYGNTWYHHLGFGYGNSIAMSSCGKYQTIVTKDPDGGNGTLYVSNDYGTKWTSKFNSYGLDNITMTSDGKTQILSVYGAGGGFISNDYGQTWSQSLTAPTQSQAVAISSNGKYIIYGGASSNSPIYISKDYGENWSLPITGINFIPFQSQEHLGHSISSNGKYQSTIRRNGYIYVSKDYGDIWSAKSGAGSRNWSSISMSDDGKYMAAAVNNGYIYLSKDYGDTWSPNTEMGSRTWTSVKLNSNAKYLVAVANSNSVYTSKTDEQIDGNLFAGNFYGNNLVYNTGNQTVSGIKNFASRPQVNGTGVVLSGEISFRTFSELPITFNQTLTDTNNAFGNTVKLSEDEQVLIVGAPLDDTNGTNNGAAFIYTRNINSLDKWKLKQKITGDNGISYVQDLYGASLAVNKDGSVILLGGPYDSLNGSLDSQYAGAVLIFTGSGNNGWSFTQKVSGDSAGDFFGSSMSISSDGSILIIGAKGDTSSPAYGGSTFIFTGNSQLGWKFKQKLINDGSSVNGQYGISTAINESGSIIAVGGNQMNNKGAVFIHTGNANNGWSSFIQKISGQNNLEAFGQSLSINNDGNILVVGAPYNNNGGTDAGAVYIYSGNNAGLFNIKQIITGITGDQFGSKVSISNNQNILIQGNNGAYFYTGNINTKWYLKETILNNNIYDVHIKNQSFVIGKPNENSVDVYRAKPSIQIYGDTEISGNVFADLNIYGARPKVNGSGIMLQNEVIVAIVPPETVYTTGNQTINGVKTFSIRPQVNGTGVLLSGEAAQVDLSSTVRTTGNQTVSGIKTFANRPKFNNFDISVSGDQFKNYYFETVSVGTNIFIKSGRNVFADIYTYSDIGTVNVFLPSGNNCLVGDELSLSLGGNGAIFDIYRVQQIGPVSSIVKFYTTTENREFLNFINTSNNGLNWSLLPIENETKKLIKNVVYTSGNQLISGTKIFTTNSVLYSGVNVNFDSNTNVKFSGQVSFSNDRSWTTGISLGSSSYTIPYYNGSFLSTPKVLTTIEVTGSTVFNHNIKNRTTSQFTLLFPSILTENVTLNVRAVL